MTGPNGPGTAAARSRHRTYFFLSYAHSAPTSDAVRTDTDPWVGQLFLDLSAEVSRRARPGGGTDTGFFDQHIPLGVDWKVALADALSAAEVFVPLYSPGYFSRPWALGEQKSFRSRLAEADVADAAERLVPVLWIPLPPWVEHPELAPALRLGEDIPEYSENGLRALCMLAAYREPYETLLGRLAERIVAVAERAPLRPSRAPALAEMAPGDVASDPAFAVAVLAPTVVDGPPEGRYGRTGVHWRPFVEQRALPVAEYAASTAERLGLPTRIVDFADAGPLLRRCPAVVLTDPWLVARPGGVQAIRAAAEDLPPWAMPLVVSDGADQSETTRATDLAGAAVAMLRDAGIRQARQVHGIREFVELMPVLVTQARRQYLRHFPMQPSGNPPPANRPRLGYADPSPYSDPPGSTDAR
ncbi:TIR-like protein FxsC [Plantactinospora sp. KBS50]|uniref:TIR-like protein FxsC n=1 Tax=Plantactinospora sp. KBS50 TaxID=2024580 RepID=UPI000BAB0C81|nr:TIR-like protein FxsC [Plantactinospora sp. KBS50]ASW54131.1 hypothetical protein CIK06_07890 [Plantactinospora sp. KBS50]